MSDAVGSPCLFYFPSVSGKSQVLSQRSTDLITCLTHRTRADLNRGPQEEEGEEEEEGGRERGGGGEVSAREANFPLVLAVGAKEGEGGREGDSRTWAF